MDDQNQQCCGNCRWYAHYEGVCCNGAADDRADFTAEEYVCEHWEGENKNGKIDKTF